MAKGENKAAIIQLKEALIISPDSAKGRFMLGKALLESGEPAAAALELNKAKQLNYSNDDVVPLLTKALYSTGQFQKLIDQYGKLDLADRKASAELKTTVAASYAQLNKPVEARRNIEEAFAKAPDFPPTLMLKARLAAFERHGDDALAIMDKVLMLTPNDPQAWFQKGEFLTLLKNDVPGAIKAFSIALQKLPRHLGARAALTEALIGQRDFTAAASSLAELRKIAPSSPAISYLEAKIAFVRGDLPKALATVELALKAAPDDLAVLQLAGNVQAAGGALLQAERSMSKALSLKPDLSAVRGSLAQTQLRMGQAEKALATLQPLLVTDGENAAVRALVGETQLAMGRFDQARTSFEYAVKLDPLNKSSKTKLVLAKQSLTGYRATVASLREIAAADTGTSADLALISLLLQEKDTSGALKAIDAIGAKLPKNPLPHNLRARVHLLRNEADAAKASFEQALTIDPVFVPAVAGLAAIDVREKNFASAKTRFEAVLKVDSKNLEAQMALIKLRGLEGAPKTEIADMLSQVIRQNPSEAAPRVQLIELQLAEKNYRAAQTAAREAGSRLPDHAEVLDLLGRAEMSAGETEQAIVSFNKLLSIEPKSTRPYMRLAAVHLAEGRVAVAERNLQRALSLAPDYLAAQQALIRIFVSAKKFGDAISIARSVQSQRVNETIGHDLEAEIEYSRGNVEAAIEVYRRSLKRHSVPILAVKLHAALRGARQTESAQKFAADWLNTNPKDPGFLAYLGDLAMSQGQYESAELSFRKVIALRPENPEALNNIAYCLAKQNKPGAVAFAEQALKQRPNVPGVMDTLALALASDGQVPKAIEVQRRAVGLAPDDLMLRLSLAKLLLQSGEKPAATLELRALEQAGGRFPEQGEVARLLKQL